LDKIKCDVTNLKLANEGRKRIEWADNEMPVLREIRKQFARTKPLKSVRVSCCLHVTKETANLMRTLKSGGADVKLCASNPLSTQDSVAASLVIDFGIPVFARHGENHKTYYRHIDTCVKHRPHITVDDGCDLNNAVHKILKNKSKSSWDIYGGTEETTTGVVRLRNMEHSGVLLYPVIAVNDARTKHLFDNRYGTGQSTMDGIIRATNVLLSGKILVVAGYGWCGRGVAMRASGMGARVVVTEVDPVRALEAAMDGYQVLPMKEAASLGDIFVTVTGDRNVITTMHFKSMKDGAIVSNAGHFDVEVDIQGLKKAAIRHRQISDVVDEYTLPNKKRIYLLAQGRLVNLSAAEGHPPSVMDMSFANQAFSVEYLVKNAGKLNPRVYSVPEQIDTRVARLKLKAMGRTIDILTPAQRKYLNAWAEGT